MYFKELPFLESFDIIAKESLNPKDFFTGEFSHKLLEYIRETNCQIDILLSADYFEERNVFFQIIVPRSCNKYLFMPFVIDIRCLFDAIYQPRQIFNLIRFTDVSIRDIFKGSSYTYKFLSMVNNLLALAGTLNCKRDKK